MNLFEKIGQKRPCVECVYYKKGKEFLDPSILNAVVESLKYSYLCEKSCEIKESINLVTGKKQTELVQYDTPHIYRNFRFALFGGCGKIGLHFKRKSP